MIRTSPPPNTQWLARLMPVFLLSLLFFLPSCLTQNNQILPKSTNNTARTTNQPVPATVVSQENHSESTLFSENYDVFVEELIDLSSCVKGLSGNLSTGQAGHDFLAAYGRLPRTSAVIAESEEKLATLGQDLAPSSNKHLRLSQGITDQLLINAYSQTGRPYRQDGQNPGNGFDESGLIRWLYAQAGMKISPLAREQISGGKAVPREDLRPGDILVFKNPKTSDFILGLYSGKGNFIHASNKLGVVTEAAAFGSEYGPYFVGIRRYFDDPQATPLTDELKASATNGAIKMALSEMGDNVPKPSNIYGGSPKKQNIKTYSKNKKNQKKHLSRKNTARRAVSKKR